MSQLPWFDELQAALHANQLAQLVLSRPLTATSVSKIVCRPLKLRDERVYQWTIRRGTQEFHENLEIAEVVTRISAAMGTQFGDLHWFAGDGDYSVRFKSQGQWQRKRKPPTKRADLAPVLHNRRRNYLIPEDAPCPFLAEAGVMLADGRVKPTAYHKFRQINRYLEFVHDIYQDLPATGPLHIVDFGCGKSSLTFALYHYFTIHRQRPVRIVGLDRKAEVVAHCNAIAQKLKFDGLQFIPGEIHTYQPTQSVDLAISLHACDTATDDALATALRWQSSVIFAVPCCQHELNQLLPDSVLPGLTGYGLLRERLASMATDALRARYLEAQGYHTQILEFIETEHTPKNVLIRAVRRSAEPEADAARLAAARLAAYGQLKQQLGLTDFHLERVASL